MSFLSKFLCQTAVPRSYKFAVFLLLNHRIVLVHSYEQLKEDKDKIKAIGSKKVYQLYWNVFDIPHPLPSAVEPCPIGTIGSTKGLAALSECQPCPSGSYCDTPGISLPSGQCHGGYICISNATTPIPGTKGDVDKTAFGISSFL